MAFQQKNLADFDMIQRFFIQLQEKVCRTYQSLERNGECFLSDKWHSSSGEGSSNILQKGRVWEKVGVNFSSIRAASLPQSAKKIRIADSPFKVCGISIVVHPRNPFVPSSHLNLRFFLVDGKPIQWWFGGGFDLTPYYPQEEDCLLWHKSAKATCDKFDQNLYEEFKQNCDRYFYLPHRQEMRGVGGLFFDEFNRWELARCFALTKELGECYLGTYMRLVHKYKDKSYGDKERNFQLHRRGRYAEFNLLYDRGTLFGLESKGRIESILMSLPPLTSWHYSPDYPAPSAEGRLAEFLQPQDWVGRKSK